MTRCEFCTQPLVLGWHVAEVAQVWAAFVLLGLVAGAIVVGGMWVESL